MKTLTNTAEFATIHRGTREFNKLKSNMEMRHFISSYGFKATRELADEIFALRDAKAVTGE